MKPSHRALPAAVALLLASACSTSSFQGVAKSTPTPTNANPDGDAKQGTGKSGGDAS